MSPFRMALVTVPDQEVALEIARVVVQERLAACVNVVPGLRSIYRWQDAVQDDRELLLVLKTKLERVESLRDRVLELHPYDTPEFVVLEIVAGSRDYLSWLSQQVDPGGSVDP